MTFDFNDGRAQQTLNVTHGSSVTEPVNPTRVGYNFKGWFSDKGCYKQWRFSESGFEITKDMTLYALWYPDGATEVSLKFNLNNDSGDVISQMVPKNELARKPDDPVRAGYIFAGWYSNSTCTMPWIWDFNKITGNTELYARWIPDTTPSFTVTFDYNDGNTSTTQVRQGMNATEPQEPTREGYEFKGWYFDKGCYQQYSFIASWSRITKDTTLYALWYPQGAAKVNIRFDPNNGGAKSQSETVKGQLVRKPDDPVWAAHEFAGWYKESVCTNPWNWDTDIITTDTTLYAKWVPDTAPSYTVKFMNDGNVYRTDSVKEGMQCKVPPAPEKLGYKFVGWFKDSACTQPWNFTTSITGDTTLYAKWALGRNVRYYDNYNSSGGSIISQILAYVGDLITKPADPAREGYEFNGWYKDTDCTAGQEWDFDNDRVTDVTNLYAKWTPANTPSSQEAEVLTAEMAELAQPTPIPEAIEPIEVPTDDEQTAPEQSQQPADEPTEQPEQSQQPADEPTDETPAPTEQEPQDPAPPVEPQAPEPALVPKPVTEPIAPEELEPMPEQ